MILKRFFQQPLASSISSPVRLTSVLLITLLPALLCSGYPAAAQTASTILRTLAVNGRGEIKVTASLAEVTLELNARNADPLKAQQEIAQRSERVLTWLREQQVDNLTAPGVQLTQNYRRDKRKNRRLPDGYTASNQIRFRVASESVGQILSAVVALGVNEVQRVQFVASDAAIAEAKEQAISQASANALAKANAALQPLNQSVKNILTVQVDRASSMLPVLVLTPEGSLSTTQVASLEAPVAELNANQFSTTTKLNGQTTFDLSNTFTGQDLLETRLQSAGSVAADQSFFASVTLLISY